MEGAHVWNFFVCPKINIRIFHSINSADHHIPYLLLYRALEIFKTFQTNKNVFERTDYQDTDTTPTLGPLEPVQQRHAKYSNEDITRQIILLSETYTQYTHIQPRTLSKYWFCHTLAPAPHKNAFCKLNFFLRQTPIIVGNQYGAICKYFWYIL